MKHSIRPFVIAVILALALACGVVINNDQFDSEKWKKGDARTRGKMVYDLQNSRLLIGKTQAEADEMLGKSSYEHSFGRVYEIDTNVMTDIYFTVHFDERTGKVISTDIGD